MSQGGTASGWKGNVYTNPSAISVRRAGSSVWQSDGLLSRRSRVQIPSGPFSASNNTCRAKRLWSGFTPEDTASERSEVDRLSRVQIPSGPYNYPQNAVMRDTNRVGGSEARRSFVPTWVHVPLGSLWSPIDVRKRFAFAHSSVPLSLSATDPAERCERAVHSAVAHSNVTTAHVSTGR